MTKTYERQPYPVPLLVPGAIVIDAQVNAVEAFFRAFPEKKQPLWFLPNETYAEVCNEGIVWFNSRGYE